MHNRPGTKTQREHEAGGPNEQIKPFGGIIQKIPRDVRNPTVSAQFNKPNHRHQQQHEQQYRRSKFSQHTAHAQPMHFCLRRWELLAEEQKTIDDGWDKVGKQDDFPSLVLEHYTEQSSENQAARPARVQDVETMRSLL